MCTNICTLDNLCKLIGLKNYIVKCSYILLNILLLRFRKVYHSIRYHIYRLTIRCVFRRGRLVLASAYESFFHQGQKHNISNIIRGIYPLCPTARHASVDPYIHNKTIKHTFFCHDSSTKMYFSL